MAQNLLLSTRSKDAIQPGEGQPSYHSEKDVQLLNEGFLNPKEVVAKGLQVLTCE